MVVLCGLPTLKIGRSDAKAASRVLGDEAGEVGRAQEGALLVAAGEDRQRAAGEGLLDEGRHHEAAGAGLARAADVERADDEASEAAVAAVDRRRLGQRLGDRVLEAGVVVRRDDDVVGLGEHAAAAVDLGAS